MIDNSKNILFIAEKSKKFPFRRILGKITKEFIYKRELLRSDNYVHVPTLYQLTKDLQKDFPQDKIIAIDLGCCGGSGTIGLLAAINELNGLVISLDVLPCSDILFDKGLNNWEFYQANSRTFKAPTMVYMVFLDSSHLYQDTIFEIKNWIPQLKVNGIMTFHDTNSSGVIKPINLLLKLNPDKFTFKNDGKSGGFGILKKLSDDINWEEFK